VVVVVVVVVVSPLDRAVHFVNLFGVSVCPVRCFCA